MSAFTDPVEALKDHLGPAPMRLLQAIMGEIGSPDPGSNVAAAPKAAVLAKLAAVEGSGPLDPDALRQRIQSINKAARESAGDEPAFKIISAAKFIKVDFSQGTVRSRTQGQIVKIAEDDVGHEDSLQGRALARSVFISYYRERAQGNIIQEFLEALQDRLTYPGPRWAEVGPVKVIQGCGGDESLLAHSLAGAARSDCGVFLVSDGWSGNESCRREADVFRRRNRAFDDERILRVQLLGDPRANSDEHRGPCYPQLWFHRHVGRDPLLNLVAAWARLNPPDRDDLTAAIRDEICASLTARPPRRSPRDQKRGPPVLKAAILAIRRSYGWFGDEAPEEPLARELEDQDAVPILPLLTDWACDDTRATQRICALLGSFGAGKTTTARALTRALIGPEARRGCLPLYLDLRRLNELFDGSRRLIPLQDLIVHALRSDAAGQIDAGQLLETLRRERSVVIFDGLDEIGTRLGVERAAALFRQFLEIVPTEAWRKDVEKGAADWRACPTRLLVTCRSHFFRTHIEATETLGGYGRHDTYPKARDALRPKTFHMAPFTPAQVASFLVKTLGAAAGERAVALIDRIRDLPGLSRRPIMTRFIAEIVPELERRAAEGGRINVAVIYQELFEKSLARDGEKQIQLSVRDRSRLLEELAFAMWQSQTPSLNADALEDWFDQFVSGHPALRSLFAATGARPLLQTELRNASFLVREGGDAFTFVHTSFQEYFLARALLHRLHDGTLNDVDVTKPLSEETVAFLLDIAESDDTAAKLRASLDRAFVSGWPVELRDVAWQWRAAAADRWGWWQLPIGADLSQLDLRRTRFGADGPGRIDRVSFAGADLLESDWRDITAIGCDFSGANLAQATFENCRLDSCLGSPTGLASTRTINSQSDAMVGPSPLDHAGFAFTDGPATKGTLSIGASKSAIVMGVAFAPDGRSILTGSLDGTARLFATDSGREIACFRGHEDQVTSVAFAPDGRSILTGSLDKTARLFATDSGREIACFRGHEDQVTSVAFAPDGRSILTGSLDKTARLFATDSGREIACFRGHEAAIMSVAFAPDGRSILTGSRDGTARLFATDSGREIACFRGHEDIISSVAFAPDGRSILTGSHDGTARLFATDSGREIACFRGHEDAITSVAFAPDGRSILTGSHDGTARLFATDSGREIACFRGHNNWISSVAFAPDGRSILTGSRDETARLFATDSGREIACFRGHEDAITSVAFAPDGRSILAGSHDNTARLFATDSGREIACFRAHEAAILSVAFAPDGRSILTGSLDKTARLFATDSGREIACFRGHNNWISSVAFAPDGRSILTGSLDNTARLFATDSGREIACFRGHEDIILSVAFAPDGRSILTGSLDKTARLFATDSGREIACFRGHNNWISSVAFAPDGRSILTGSLDKTARLFATDSGREIACFRGHEAAIMSVAFAPDGRSILTGSRDGTARLFATDSGREIACFRGHEDIISSVAFAPDGRSILTGSLDGTWRTWDIDTARCRLIVAVLANGWARLTEDRTVIAGSPNIWRYLYGLERREGALPKVYAPTAADLARIVDAGKAKAPTRP